MKFVAIRSNVREALAAIQRASTENANVPILKNVLINAEANGIVFVATNLEMAVTAQVSGKVVEAGKVSVPLSLLVNLISNLQSDRINFEKKGDHLEIKTDNYSASLQGISTEEFPPTPKIGDTEHFIEIKGMFLKEAIQQVTVASQFSDLRPELNSVFFSFAIESIKLAATDGFRLAEKTIPKSVFTTKFVEPFHMLIPLKTAYEISRIVGDADIVRIFHDENQVLVTTEKTQIISRLSEGSFPDYSAIIPNSFVGEVIMNKEEFASAVKLAGVFSQKNNELKVILHPHKKAIELSSADQSFGENNYLLPAKIKGEASETSFNAKYLTDVVKSLNGEDVFLGLQAEANPALIKSFTDGSYFYILKPIMKA
jgi:DNA polymerase-3 subunit beta